MLRKLLRWTLIALAVLVGLAAVGYALAYNKVERGLARTYTVADPPLLLERGAPAIERGGHLFATRGCADCHGEGAQGKLVFDAGPVMKVVGPNITPGGVLASRTADQVAAAIRHGVKPDGHAMVFMPTEDFHEMSDADTAAIIAWLQSLPPSANDPGKLEIRPLGRVMYALGKFPLLPAEAIDHAPRTRSAPVQAATAEYGAYIANGCLGCHGKNLAGQHVPGTPPSFPDAANLTPTSIGAWTQADFHRALRTGVRPDGSKIDPFMPWQAFSKMSDQELDALWAYLRTLPPAGTARPKSANAAP